MSIISFFQETLFFHYSRILGPKTEHSDKAILLNLCTLSQKQYIVSDESIRSLGFKKFRGSNVFGQYRIEFHKNSITNRKLFNFCESVDQLLYFSYHRSIFHRFHIILMIFGTLNQFFIAVQSICLCAADKRVDLRIELKIM